MRFDKDGMYPQHNCKGCNKPLNADSGHPAELYAGTYTGLCYTCERAPRYIIKTFCDGAIRYSYAPQCPSWRRDRKEFIAYTDCTDCRGNGRISHYSYSSWSDYFAQCQACSDRFYNYPPRKARLDYIQERRKMIRAATESIWARELAKLYTKEQLKQMIKDKFDFRSLSNLAEPIRAKFYRIDARWEAIIAKRYTDNLL